MFDLIIKNGSAIDGTGAAVRKADVGISGDRIEAIEDLSRAQAARVIDASGRYVTPGFIDIHTHTDETVLINPRVESKIHQGVTTEVAGNCGSSAAPLAGDALAEMQRRVREYETLQVDWRSMGEFLERVEQNKVSTNYVTLVGHGMLRACVMGYAMRVPTPDELKVMRNLLARSLDEGACGGMSTGLIYPPSSYANIDEIVELAKVVVEKGGIYASHIRNESERLLPSVDEALTVGRRTGARVQLSHHKAAGKKNWGKVHASLAMIEQARKEGVLANADQYPYIASSTGLSTVIPHWVHEGGPLKLVERLLDSETRKKIAETIRNNPRSWSDVMVAGCKSDRTLQGKTIQQISEMQSKDPVEMVCELLVANEGAVNIVNFTMSEEDVQTVMQAPWVFVGSDAAARAPTGPLAKVQYHPRSYGTFPRSLGRYARELHILKWEEAIAKMTERPAQALGLERRGALRKGYYADIVVFDPATVNDTATYAEPIQVPVGIDYVIVNGEVTVEHGHHLGTRAGAFCARARSTNANH